MIMIISYHIMPFYAVLFLHSGPHTASFVINQCHLIFAFLVLFSFLKKTRQNFHVYLIKTRKTKASTMWGCLHMVVPERLG